MAAANFLVPFLQIAEGVEPGLSPCVNSAFMVTKFRTFFVVCFAMILFSLLQEFSVFAERIFPNSYLSYGM